MGDLWGIFAIELMVKIKEKYGGNKETKTGRNDNNTVERRGGGKVFFSLSPSLLNI
ncbi:unnamed protein product [Meloidogyne enterolobii]|uniref:Uncharacterized protein n=1 Tax=Meloidogyne enterolobii TaxID=390850 RepID=A0ACB0ZGG1_MELEN